ncbi:MAG: adenosylcobalamin-dependent ribonucleoside-diphosphate reductase [Nitrospirae bacterium]|nr:adenosylcobalamin-dependent ribonucleoside-diphosphate reductase [Nitrospirota bacterium]
MPRLTPNAIKLLEQRYLRKNPEGRVIETPGEMFHRVALHVASADLRYSPKNNTGKTEERFFRRMSHLEFLPNSPTLMNAGGELGQLAACFVLPVEDSLESIFDAVKHCALIHQSGGGTGFSFSRLRPKNDPVSSAGGVASGPVSFMRAFNIATEVIKQGGTRRGANMGVLRVDHPDILEFIEVKNQPGELTNFNLSVAVTDRFMKAFRADGTYPLVNPRTGRSTTRLAAREVFRRIAEAAWRHGEPGVLFIDRINRSNPTPAVGRIEATNPCGEQPLLPYEACTLGSINLSRMLKQTETGWEVDFTLLEETVRDGIHFLDNVLDVNRYPLPRIGEISMANRKIGLGVMGFADMLIRLGIPYDSEEAVRTADRVMAFIQKKGRDASIRLAATRGPFPNFKGSRLDREGEPLLRNVTVTTIAPTGSLSIIGACSGGIEPLYGVSFVRNVLDGVRLPNLHPLFLEMAREKGIYNAKLIKRVTAAESIRDLPGIPESMRRLFVTAFDVSPSWHVRMQAVFQKHVDNAVSKTINLPPNATREEVETAYLEAYRLGCKGITVYRSGTRANQVLSCANVLYC